MERSAEKKIPNESQFTLNMLSMVIMRLCSVLSMGARTSSKLSPRIQSVCVVMCSVIDWKIFENEFRLKKIFSACVLISFAASKSVHRFHGKDYGFWAEGENLEYLLLLFINKLTIDAFRS